MVCRKVVDDMWALTKKELSDRNRKLQDDKGYPNIPENTWVLVDGSPKEKYVGAYWNNRFYTVASKDLEFESLEEENPPEFSFCTDEQVNDLQVFIEENFALDGTSRHLIANILGFVAAQGYDGETALDILETLLNGIAIQREEIVAAVMKG